MIDFINNDWKYDFTRLRLFSPVGCEYELSIMNGNLGWVASDLVWRKDQSKVQRAYEAWLDKQIYGESDD